MSADTFHTVGGFDSAMRTMEDWEFGLRCQKLNIPIVSAPEIEPYHQLHPTDLLRPELDESALAHFRKKHPDVFCFRDGANAARIPGIDVLRGTTMLGSGGLRESARPEKKSGVLVLTFDDGPHPVGTSRLLQVLTTLQAGATFFVLGSNVVRHPGILREIAAAGCEIGVHGWEHTPSFEQTFQEIVRDLKKTASVIANLTGIKPRFCRPPHGKASPGYLRAAAQARLMPVGWHVSVRDWRSLGPCDLTIELATKRLVGKVLLLHDAAGDPNSTAEVLAWLLNCARANGIKVVSLGKAEQETGLPVLPAVPELRQT